MQLLATHSAGVFEWHVRLGQYVVVMRSVCLCYILSDAAGAMKCCSYSKLFSWHAGPGLCV